MIGWIEMSSWHGHYIDRGPRLRGSLKKQNRPRESGGQFPWPRHHEIRHGDERNWRRCQRIQQSPNGLSTTPNGQTHRSGCRGLASPTGQLASERARGANSPSHGERIIGGRLDRVVTRCCTAHTGISVASLPGRHRVPPGQNASSNSGLGCGLTPLLDRFDPSRKRTFVASAYQPIAGGRREEMSKVLLSGVAAHQRRGAWQKPVAEKTAMHLRYAAQRTHRPVARQSFSKNQMPRG